MFAAPSADLESYITLTKWFKENIWKEARQPRGAVLAVDTTSGRQSEHPLFFKMAKEQGWEWLPHVYFRFGCTDFSTELTKLVKDYKVDMVITKGTPADQVAMLKDATRLGFKDKVSWIIGSSMSTPYMVGVAGKEIMAGCYLHVGAAGLPGEDVPAVKKITELQRKYRGEEKLSGLYMEGVRFSQIADVAIRGTLQRVGLQGLGGREIANTLWGIKDLDLGGNGPNLTMQKGNLALCHHLRVAKWADDGSIVPASEWIELPWMTGNPEIPWRLK